MSAQKRVFVIGASGYVGKATIAALSSNYGDTVEIFAGTRNPDKADPLKLPGVNIVRAEMGRHEELKEIFKGVDALFIVTPGPTHNQVSLTTITADAAKEAGVKFIMVVSVEIAELRDSSPYGRASHDIESHVKKIGVPYCILRLPGFMDENLLSYSYGVKKGSTIRSASLPDKVSCSITLSDIGKAASTILCNYTSHINTTYLIIGDIYCMSDVVKCLSEVLGREIKYSQMTSDEFKQMLVSFKLNETTLDAIMELSKLVNEGNPVIKSGTTATFKNITGDDPLTLKDWIIKNSAAFC